MTKQELNILAQNIVRSIDPRGYLQGSEGFKGLESSEEYQHVLGCVHAIIERAAISPEYCCNED